MLTYTIATNVCFFVSLVSGITVMGDPSEIYTYGTLYWLGCFCAPFVGILNSYFYLPVFYELQITSIYEVSNCPLC
jgi:Na+/proline symporter